MTRSVVAGIEGSVASPAADSWAAEEAGRRGGELVVFQAGVFGAAGLLAEMSAETGLVVLRSHGRGEVRDAVNGSVALRVAATARCPVVVWGDPAHDGPVAVGVGNSDGGERAPAFAFEAAASRGAVLEAVHVSRGGMRRERSVREQVTGWAGKRPGVPVRVHLVQARSDERALAGISSGAQLIVVGGRGPVAGGRLGTMGDWLLGHADCPVAVVR
ncbi:universal stress protein [Amycolatopsis panacis]|uniref:Universal stress protein n=1 Tax=Amycolatopsis panacis TaxID=2340917 RepID=A0A419I6S0_9PSEU|nr:universal stress protein [Amycolatopsis panacis]RJQ87266.1 universal stress protein [Amycolatopsis panacis]